MDAIYIVITALLENFEEKEEWEIDESEKM